MRPEELIEITAVGGRWRQRFHAPGAQAVEEYAEVAAREIRRWGIVALDCVYERDAVTRLTPTHRTKRRPNP
ncbi:hypothetical protein [Streptomyces sp. NPDC051662]|uniref:hypothetical protein n=1 Tax=Streptomyces sp. NPDC051662 TaxID=3154750 RepID=UPI0034249984